MNRPTKRKYPTDTELRIRTITQIRDLPSCELTDEEFVKEFFDRFDAKALVMAYMDDEGKIQTLGRVKRGLKPLEWYRVLLRKVDDIFVALDIKEMEE